MYVSCTHLSEGESDDDQSTVIKFDQQTDFGHMTHMTHRQLFSAVFGMLNTASARTVYGHIRYRFRGLRYGYGTHTNRAVQPYCMVRQAVLALSR
jgi:hypothetical protein